MTRPLVTALRNLAQDCETIAAAARKALREMESAELLGTVVDEAAIDRAVTKLERRFLAAARRIGVRP